MILLMVPHQLPAQEQTERHYRVELIVVRHLAGSSDPTPQKSLRDLTAVLDLYAPVDTSPISATANTANEVTDPSNGDAELPPEEPIAVRIDDMSDAMRETWRRLRGSAGFRPELFRAWEQSGNRPFPQLRIHDDELLYEIDPSTVPGNTLGSAPRDEHGALVFSDQTMNLATNASRNPESAMLSGAEQQAPPLQYFYRIDGSALLTRSRFLHIDLDIELREPLYETPVGETPAVSSDTVMLPAESVKRTGPAANASAFRVHRIAQKRQVKAGQMEYFDGPVIGLLVLVTGFDVNSEAAEPEPVL